MIFALWGPGFWRGVTLTREVTALRRKNDMVNQNEFWTTHRTLNLRNEEVHVWRQKNSERCSGGGGGGGGR